MTHLKGEASVLFSINSNREKYCDAADLVNSVNSSSRRVRIICDQFWTISEAPA